MLSVLSVAHLRSPSPPAYSAFTLVAGWDLPVISWPATFQFMRYQCPALSRPSGSQGNQQSGLSQSSCFLPLPRVAWQDLVPLLGRTSGPRVLGFLPSLPSDQPGPTHVSWFGSFPLLSGRTLRSLPFSPPFLPSASVYGATLGPRFQASGGHRGNETGHQELG